MAVFWRLGKGKKLNRGDCRSRGWVRDGSRALLLGAQPPPSTSGCRERPARTRGGATGTESTGRRRLATLLQVYSCSLEVSLKKGGKEHSSRDSPGYKPAQGSQPRPCLGNRGAGRNLPPKSLRQPHKSTVNAERGSGSTQGTFRGSPGPNPCCQQSWLHRGLGFGGRSSQQSPGGPRWPCCPQRGGRETNTIPRASGEDGFLPPLLGEDGARLVLGVGVVGQLGGAGGDGALQDGLLQVVEDGGVLLGEEGDGHAALPCAARPPDAVDVICRGVGESGRATPPRAPRQK